MDTVYINQGRWSMCDSGTMLMTEFSLENQWRGCRSISVRRRDLDGVYFVHPHLSWIIINSQWMCVCVCTAHTVYYVYTYNLIVVELSHISLSYIICITLHHIIIITIYAWRICWKRFWQTFGRTSIPHRRPAEARPPTTL